MRKTKWLSAILAVGFCFGFSLNLFAQTEKQGHDYPITPSLPIQVKVDDSFWSPRLKTNAKVTLPYCIKKCEETGRIGNFYSAGKANAGEKNQKFIGTFFDDSDVSKVLEGAAYVYAGNPDPKLEKQVNEIIAAYGRAQEKDGYLYCSRTILDPTNMPPGGVNRWSDVGSGHELYNVGHMYEAGVAWYQATGNRNLLDICLKNADLVCSVFNKDGRYDVPGHQEIEVGLSKLYRITGDQKYLDEAKWFLDRRGRKENRTHLYMEYSQDHKPVVEQDEPVGHSVRCMYMLMGMADVAALNGSQEYIDAINRLWNNVVSKKMYITGGVGAAGGHEGFGGDYELPNQVAYCETCAAIGVALWNHRMFLMTGDSKYMDVVELAIYNGFLSGISLEGDSFFYPNPLESLYGAKRSPWFGCSCCPTNIVRFIPQIPGMTYGITKNEDGKNILYINLFIGGEANLTIDGVPVTVVQKTNYPWDGKISFDVKAEKPIPGGLEVRVRIPGWAQGQLLESDLYSVATPNVPKFSSPDLKDGYLVYSMTEKSTELAKNFELPMEPLRIKANDQILDDQGKLAVMRGPIVFCAEGIDQENHKVLSKVLPLDSELTGKFNPELLGGVYVLEGKAFETVREKDGTPVLDEETTMTLIPYYAWAHRDNGGPMTTWFPAVPKAAKPKAAPTIAALSEVSAQYGGRPTAIQDQFEPKHSNDKANPSWHTWPEFNKSCWVEYKFAEEAEVSSVEIYWFDETSSNQAVRVPKSWKLLAKVDGEWKEVENPSEYGCEKDKYCKTTFKPIKTSGLRLEIEPQKDWCLGIHEWIVK